METVRFRLQPAPSTRAASVLRPLLLAGQEEVFADEWLVLGLRDTVFVGLSNVIECSLPNTLKMALPSFSMPLVQS